MPQPVKLLRLSKEMEHGEVMQWLKSEGDSVQVGEPLFTVLTDKAEVEVEAPAGGVLLQILVPAGGEARVGSVVAWIGEREEQVERRNSTRAKAPAPAAPAARRRAAELGISLDGVEGTGPGGLITLQDVEGSIRPEASAGAAPAPAAEREEGGAVRRVRLSGIRKQMFERLSAGSAAAVTTVMDVDMAAASALKKDRRLTFTAIVARATALALRSHPLLNASLEGDEILMHSQVHLGVAVDTERGLQVIVLEEADSQALAGLDETLRRLASQARQGFLPAPSRAATFTLTNSGVFGSLLFTPLINPPQSAILGMGKIQETPVVVEGRILARPLMYLNLTYDHRLIAGGEAVAFVREVKQLLEKPAAMEEGKGGDNE